MIRRSLVAGATCVVLGAVLAAQSKTVPRPPAQPAGQQPAGESAAPDGYQPLPQWLGQTRAPVPAKTESFTVETFTQGLNGAAFRFLPDGRILLGERDGRIRIVGRPTRARRSTAGCRSSAAASSAAIACRSRRSCTCASATPATPS